MTARAFACAAVAASALVVPAASAAPATVLAGTTVLTTTGAPASADVVVPRDAWVATPLGAVTDLAVSAHEGLAAFALVGTGGHARGTVVIGGADGGVPFLLPLPAYPRGAGGDYGYVRTFTDRTAVPSGTYRLYAVGAPATMTLRLRGLAGRTTVAAARRVTAEVARNDVPAPATTNDYTGAGTRHLTVPALVFEVLTVRSEVSAAWQLTMCYKHSRPDVPETAWSHGCPDAESFTNAVHRAPEAAPTVHAFVQGVVGAPPGDIVQTAWFSAAAAVSAIDYATVWIAPY